VCLPLRAAHCDAGLYITLYSRHTMSVEHVRTRKMRTGPAL